MLVLGLGGWIQGKSGNAIIFYGGGGGEYGAS